MYSQTLIGYQVLASLHKEMSGSNNIPLLALHHFLSGRFHQPLYWPSLRSFPSMAKTAMAMPPPNGLQWPLPWQVGTRGRGKSGSACMTPSDPLWGCLHPGPTMWAVPGLGDLDFQ